MLGGGGRGEGGGGGGGRGEEGAHYEVYLNLKLMTQLIEAPLFISS